MEQLPKAEMLQNSLAIVKLNQYSPDNPKLLSMNLCTTVLHISFPLTHTISAFGLLSGASQKVRG